MTHRKINYDDPEAGDRTMDAFMLAERFVEFLNAEWTRAPDTAGPLLEFFMDWAEEVDLPKLTGGQQATALQSLFVSWVWFTQRPQDFGLVAPYITGLADISLDARELPAPLDPKWWFERLSNRKSESR